MTPRRWAALMASFGLGPHAETYETLAAAYAEPHRRYHTAEHVAACLRELDKSRGLAGAPHEVEIAVWFHDAVYDPLGKDNEIRSADWAVTFLGQAGVAEDSQRRVYEHVIATEHASQPTRGDSALVVDIDLAILGKLPHVYERFEQQVRQEYEAVPPEVYARERARLLRSFIARASIYCLPWFRERYEVSARRNLSKRVGELQEIAFRSDG